MATRIAIVTSRPVYYYLPLFRLLNSDPDIELTVVFTTGVGRQQQGPLQSNINHYLINQEELEGYTHHFLKGGQNIRKLSGLRRSLNWNVIPYIARNKYDVVWIHGYNVGSNLLAALVQKYWVRGVVWMRDDQHLRNPRPSWKQRFKRFVLPLVFRQWSGLYVGTLNREWMTYFGIPEERLFHVPHSIGEKSEPSETAEYERPDESSVLARPVFLTVGRLVWEKDYPLLIRAFASLVQKVPCTLMVVGDGPLRQELEQLTKDLGLGPEAVMFIGEVGSDCVAQYYEMADAFVLPSKSETWGLVVNEAMTFSLPVIVSDHVGCSVDLVLEGINGYVFASGDQYELESRMQDLADSPDRRIDFGLASKKMIEDWSHERALDGVLSALAATTDYEGRGNLPR